MVLADLGRKITTALQSLSRATIINEEVSLQSAKLFENVGKKKLTLLNCKFHVTGFKFYAETNMCRAIRG